MARTCSVCSLPDHLLAIVETKLSSGLTYKAVSEWLEEQGHSITVHMLSAHKARHITLGTQKTSTEAPMEACNTHVALSMDSASLLKANVLDAIALSQKLQSLNEPANLRVSRVLVEHFRNLHQMLLEVDFDAS